MSCINFHPNHHKHLHSFRFLPNSAHRHRILPCLRFFSFIITFQTLLCIFLESQRRPVLLLAFLTIWGALFILFNFFLLVLLNFDYCKSTKCYEPCLKLNQALYTIALTFGLPIVLMFWVVLYPVLVKTDFFESHAFIWQFEIHLVIQVLLIIDFILSGTQFIRSHILLIIFVGLAYLVVNCAVTLTVFTIYPIITWRDAQTMLWVVVAVLLDVGSFYFFLWLGLKKKRDTEDRHAAMLTEEDEPKEKTHQMKQLDL